MNHLDLLRLARWVPHLSFDEIVQHPRMAEARKLYLDRFLALYDRDPFMARLLIEIRRFRVYQVAVVLGTAQNPVQRESWLTIKRLKQELARSAIANNRQADELVARLCRTGFMTSEVAEQDRRARILKPTEKMLAHDRAWLAAHYAPLTIVSRFNDYGPAVREARVYQLMHRQATVVFLPFSGKLMALAPEMRLFFNHVGGHMACAALLSAAMAATDTHAAVPYADLVERFGLSHTHIRNTLLDAQEAGLVRLHNRGGGSRVEILPRMWTSYDRGLAAGMFSHDIVHALVTGRRARKRESVYDSVDNSNTLVEAAAASK